MPTQYPLDLDIDLDLDDVVWDSERPSAVYDISDCDTIPSPPPDFAEVDDVVIPPAPPIPWFKE